ncbi:MAG: trypsin-like peptidase domain-containing protein [Candidatus Hydrogenedentes bacterium]|nr:trypsin-like peptidase domain-containing protein [Candidatus Hydrogenedentota bacterium]
MFFFNGLKACMVVVFLALAQFASAQDPCVDCQESTAEFDATEALLVAQDILYEGDQVLLAWNETSRTDPSELIRGFRILPADGTAAYDVYLDGSGALMGTAELGIHGIAPKNWDLSPAEQRTEYPKRLYASIGQSPRPKGISKAVPLEAQVKLDILDMSQIKQEDALRFGTAEKGLRRIGVFRPLDAAVRVQGRYTSVGRWEPAPDGGMTWTLSLQSPEAVGLRLHLSQLVLPAGGRLIVYNAGQPREAYGPYTGPTGSDNDLWTATCFSDFVVLECYIPPGANRDEVRIRLDRIVHIYVPFNQLQWGKAAGLCNLDVSCSPEWLNTSYGVGGIGTVGSTGFLWCTGTLIVDSDPSTNIPYFLTANHCVGDQSGASSMEVYWLYQTDQCGGQAPDAANVPRTTGGADYLAGSTRNGGTDFSLLRLRNAPPPNVSFVGWSTTPVPLQERLTVIHHPQGDFKRISFGNKSSDDGFFHSVLWTEGTTEPGSSGSPLFDASHLIVGQLYGGLASCSRPLEPDHFGRFDITHALIESFLQTDKRPENIDGMGLVDDTDLYWVIQAALGAPIPYDADVDNNGVVDSVDIQRVAVLVITG